jgi:hypothetical protein
VDASDSRVPCETDSIVFYTGLFKYSGIQIYSMKPNFGIICKLVSWIRFFFSVCSWNMSGTLIIWNLNIAWSICYSIYVTEILQYGRYTVWSLVLVTTQSSLAQTVVFCFGNSRDIIRRALRHQIQCRSSVKEEKMERVARDNMPTIKQWTFLIPNSPVCRIHNEHCRRMFVLSQTQDKTLLYPLKLSGHYTGCYATHICPLTDSSQGITKPFETQWPLYRVLRDAARCPVQDISSTESQTVALFDTIFELGASLVLRWIKDVFLTRLCYILNVYNDI